MKKLLMMDSKLKVKNASDIYNEPVVIRVTDFDEKAATAFAEDMSKAHNTGQPIIPIVIDSYGGQVDSLNSMISEIESASLPVATIVVGKAMSCGAILLTYGAEGYRFADSNARIMIHDVSSGNWGKNEEIKASAKETDRLQKQIFKKMAQNCGKADDYFLKLIHEKSHAEWYLTPQEAKKHNLINHIRVPTFHTKISVDITFT
jgi:ATP-dependent Clp protease protease subunit